MASVRPATLAMIGAALAAPPTRDELERHGPSQPGVLRLVCRKCTREGRFAGDNRDLATAEASRRGWTQRGALTICPKCLK